MSTFDGVIREFPEIQVDYFYDRGKKHKARPAVWLLSHVHTDHTVGLESVGGLVYCSRVTKDMLLAQDPRSKRHKAYDEKEDISCLGNKKSKYTSIQDRLRGLDLDTPFEINLGSYSVSVTLLDASNHCPGAVMFLIEGRGKAVLYTGDIRAEKWWLRSLENHPILLPYMCGVKRLDCIYLDTTFGYRGEPYIQFVDNNTGLASLIQLVSRYPLGSGNINFFLPRFKSGFELIWQYLAAAYNWKVHMDEDELQRMTKILRLQGRSHFASYLTSDPSEATLHCCSCQRNSSTSVLLLPVINYTIAQLQEHNRPKTDSELQLVAVKEILRRLSEEYSSSNESCLSDVVDFSSGRRFIKTQIVEGSDIFLPDILLFHYSRHSSYSECEEFVGLFKPRSVFPCVVTKDSWQAGFSMTRLFGHVCLEHVDLRSQFAYDVEMCIATAKPIPLIHQPILTVPLIFETSTANLPQTVQSFNVRAPGTQNVELNARYNFPVEQFVPGSDSGNSDILDQLNLYRSPIKSPVRTKSSPAVVVRPAVLSTTAIVVKLEPENHDLGPPVAAVPNIMPTSSPAMPTSSPMDAAVMSSPFKRASILSSMCDEIDHCEEEGSDKERNGKRCEPDSDEFCVSINSLPVIDLEGVDNSEVSETRTVVKDVAKLCGNRKESILDVPGGNIRCVAGVSRIPKENVDKTPRIANESIAKVMVRNVSFVDVPDEQNTVRASLVKPRDAPKSLSRSPSLSRVSLRRQSTMKPPPVPTGLRRESSTGLANPVLSNVVMGPPPPPKTADDIYEVCEKLGQYRLVRMKRKSHTGFKVDQWKVAQV